MAETLLRKELKFPIGEFTLPEDISDEFVNSSITEIELVPRRLKESIFNLTDSQLNTPLREGERTIKQIIHHLPDNHINAYVRMKISLIDEDPFLNAFEESKWAELCGNFNSPTFISLDLLTNLHARWTIFLKQLTHPQLQMKFFLPQFGLIEAGKAIAFYAWHGKHHLAQINNIREVKGW